MKEKANQPLQIGRFIEIANYLCLVVFLACGSVAHSRAPAGTTPVIDVAAIDSLFAHEMATRKIPGIAVAITYNGNTVFAKGYGVADLENNVPVTPDSVFAIASVSKPILAHGVARLVEQGKLSWQDPVSKHIAAAPDTWKNVTLAQLADHTSGIVRESPTFEDDVVKTDAELISATFTVPLDFPTGSKMQYCNICYFALGETIARATGESWPAFMAREIFQPNGMTSTRSTSVTDLVPRRVSSYEWKDGRYLNVREYLALRPSGAFLSSVNDLARFEAALYAGKIVSPAMQATMATPSKLNDGSLGKLRRDAIGYGLGWEVSELEGKRVLAHGGSLAGFRTRYTRFPDQGWAVVMLSNSANARLLTLEPLLLKLLPIANPQ
jgi:D-alanyl-D-alanine carboxypeptidase